MGVHLAPPTTLYVGLLDPSQIKAIKPNVSSLLRSKVPVCPQIIRTWPSGTHEDWNTGYQACYDHTATSFKQSLKRMKSMSSLNSLQKSQSQMSMISAETAAETAAAASALDEVEPKDIEIGMELQNEDTIAKTLSYAAFYGDFLEKALVGLYGLLVYYIFTYFIGF